MGRLVHLLRWVMGLPTHGRSPPLGGPPPPNASQAGVIIDHAQARLVGGSTIGHCLDHCTCIMGVSWRICCRSLLGLISFPMAWTQCGFVRGAVKCQPFPSFHSWTRVAGKSYRACHASRPPSPLYPGRRCPYRCPPSPNVVPAHTSDVATFAAFVGIGHLIIFLCSHGEGIPTPTMSHL